MLDGRLEFSFKVQGIAKISFGDGVVGSGSDRMCPERFAILPVGCLSVRLQSQGGEDDHGKTSDQYVPVSPSPGQISRGPSQEKIEADLGKISVAVGVSLVAHLKDANHRPEHDEIPEPTDEYVWPLASQKKRDGCKSSEENHRQDASRDRDVIRIKWIENHQISGPKHLAQINHAGNGGIAQTQRNRNIRQGPNPLGLGKKRDDTRCRG